jgi:ABC-2 type transport system ATP-binding protein
MEEGSRSAGISSREGSLATQSETTTGPSRSGDLRIGRSSVEGRFLLSEPISPPVVEVHALVRRFGAKSALDGVDLVVPAKGVVGIVGENGAGKTTLMKHLLGLLRAQEGSVRVFGLDPVVAPEKVLARIGYLSEEPDLPGWMTIGELLRYVRSFHPSWDEGYADRLLRAFELDPARKIKQLSKGQRARTGLVAAQAHRPDLLLLDEPSSGLDPIVRRDILAAVLRSVGDEGRAVVFSSHLLNEVESVCDRVVMISKGRIVLSDTLSALRASHLFVEASSSVASPPLAGIEGLLSIERQGERWNALCHGDIETLRRAFEGAGATVVRTRVPSLEEIFVARSGVHPLAAREEEGS